MKNVSIVLIFVLSVLFLGGCATNDLKVGALGNNKPIKPILSSNIYNMPKNASRVILAVSSKILGTDKKDSSIEFKTSYRNELLDIKYFSFENAILLSYNDGVNYGSKNIKADVFFKDSLGRSLAYSIDASYSIGTKKIIIDSFKVKDKFEALKNSVCFIMPAEKYNGVARNGILNSFYSFYKYAALNAITPKEAQKYIGKKEWAIITFTMERISKSSILKIGVSEKADKYSAVYADNTKYIDYNGWNVGVFIVKLHLLNPTPDFSLYSKTVFTPGNESKKNIFLRKPSVVGAYKLM